MCLFGGADILIGRGIEVNWCIMVTLFCLQVWDARKRRLLTEFKRHVYGVQCCAISPDEKLVLSADIDSCINVRDP